MPLALPCCQRLPKHQHLFILIKNENSSIINHSCAQIWAVLEIPYFLDVCLPQYNHSTSWIEKRAVLEDTKAPLTVIQPRLIHTLQLSIAGDNSSSLLLCSQVLQPTPNLRFPSFLKGSIWMLFCFTNPLITVWNGLNDPYTWKNTTTCSVPEWYFPYICSAVWKHPPNWNNSNFLVLQGFVASQSLLYFAKKLWSADFSGVNYMLMFCKCLCLARNPLKNIRCK